MSRPYSKNRGRGGGRGHFGGPNSDNKGGGGGGGGGGGRGGHWTNRGGFNYVQSHKNKHLNKNINNNKTNSNNTGTAGEGVAASVMTTMLDLLFQKSADTLFNSQTGMLNLSKFHESPDLASVQRSVDFNSIAFCKSLASVIKNKIGSSLRIIAANDNNIQKFTSFLTALEEADIHRGITAISVTGNNITTINFIGPLRKFDSLSELLLTGNPLTNIPNYRAQIVKSLPRLAMLDGEVIDRLMLRLPNPVLANLDETQISVLRILECGLFSPTAARNFDSLLTLYNPAAIFSVIRAEEPIPRRLPLDQRHNCEGLSAQQKATMQGDFTLLRNHINWRNLQDIHSMRNIAIGRANASLANKAIGGGDRKFFSLRLFLNGNANVVFLTHGVKVPTCVLTVHGVLKWHWSPKNSEGGDVFPPDTAPFLSCFFDRTMTLLLDNATGAWSIFNDMFFLRPDRTVVNEDGSPTVPLFFANEPHRVELMRRKYLPQATSEVMRTIIDQLGSDSDVQLFVSRHLPTLPAERLQQAMSSPVAMAELLRG